MGQAQPSEWWDFIPQSRLSQSSKYLYIGDDSSYRDDEPSGYLAMYFLNLTSFEQSRVDVIRL